MKYIIIIKDKSLSTVGSLLLQGTFTSTEMKMKTIGE